MKKTTGKFISPTKMATTLRKIADAIEAGANTKALMRGSLKIEILQQKS